MRMGKSFVRVRERGRIGHLIDTSNTFQAKGFHKTFPGSFERGIGLHPRLNRIKRMTNKTFRRPWNRPCNETTYQAPKSRMTKTLEQEAHARLLMPWTVVDRGLPRRTWESRWVSHCVKNMTTPMHEGPPPFARGSEKEGGLMGRERVNRKLVVFELLIDFPKNTALWTARFLIGWMSKSEIAL